MGGVHGVQIRNCTDVPLKIQLCQVGVLYHGLVQPGECFYRETGAVHFTIRITVSDRDDTDWTDTALPVIGFIASTGITVAGACASFGLLAPLGIAGGGPLAALVSGGVSGAGVAATSASAAMFSALQNANQAKTAMEVVAKVIENAMAQKGNRDHFTISSYGRYFRGMKYLEVHGGPKISNDLGYIGSKLCIVD